MGVIHITDNAATVVLIDVGRTPQTSQSVKLRNCSTDRCRKDTLNFSVSQATESRLTSPTMGVIHITNNAATVVLIDVGRTPQTAVSQATESRLTTPTMGVIHITDNSATVVLIDVGRTPQTSHPTMGVIHITNNAATVVLIDVGRTPQTAVSEATESRLTSPTMGVIHITNNAATVVLIDVGRTPQTSQSVKLRMLIDVGRTPQTAVSQATETRLTTPTMGVIHITDNSATVVLIDVGRTPQTSQSVKLRSHD
ncbi:hypothetical protein J6590_037728 [Homalodisca vitripennis]|nr:hypothetical protein J6590_037728 [Homalodisca vitripennis]